MEGKEDSLAALGGATGNVETEDYKSKFEELNKQLQSERVEAGRLKKAQEEIARLKSENEKLASRKGEDSILASLSDEDREDIPEDYQRGAAKIAQAAIKRQADEFNARLHELEEQLKASRAERGGMSRREFAAQLEAAYPGFLESIQPGGDKCEAWTKYQRHNLHSIQAANQSNDFETLAYHINVFYNNFLGISAPRGSFDAAPDPEGISGAPQTAHVGGGKTYTAAEYSQILEKAQEDFQSHLISASKYAEIKNELNNAFREGRIR